MDRFASASVSPILLGWFDLRGMSSLGTAVTVGITVLTITVLVLSRSRWGQAKLVSKCIALSVFAHLLLVIYAYDTQLLVAPSTAERPLGLEFNWIEVDSATNEPVADQPIFAQPPELDYRPLLVEDAPTREAAESPQLEAPALLPPSAAERERPLPSERVANSDAPPSRVEPPPLLETAPDTSSQDSTVRAPVNSPPLTAAPDPIAVGDAAASPANDSAPQKLAEPMIGEEEPMSAADRADQLAAGGDSPAAPRDAPLTTPAGMAFAGTAVEATPSPPASSSARAGDEALARPVTRSTDTLAAAAPQPDVYANRRAEDRLRIALKYGGNERTERAVTIALGWLAAAQSDDGRWDADRFGAGREARILGHDRQGAGAQADTGISALALLAFLAAGETHLAGDYRATVERGLSFLLRSQAADGNLAGEAEKFARMYCHGMATLALSEAHALTGDERLTDAVFRAAQYSLASQNGPTGGWRYLPGDPGDMSQFGWQVMALKSAHLGGIPIPTRAWTGMRRFLASASSGRHGGLASYRPGERPSPTMTAEALACRAFLGEMPNSEIPNEAGAFVLQELPRADRANFYYWYYGTLSLFQLQDQHWQIWNQAMQSALLTTQHNEGSLAGSWDPDPIWGHYGGRVFSTALGALCLEVYYRYLPLTQFEQGPQTARTRHVPTR